MFGINLPELIVIFVVALIVFGPERLPEIARNLGKLMAELRRNTDSLRREFYNSVYKPADLTKDTLTRELRSIKKNVEDDIKSAIASDKPAPTPAHSIKEPEKKE